MAKKVLFIVKEIERILIPGGRLQVVTDHKDYFEQIESVIKASNLKIVEYNRPGAAGTVGHSYVAKAAPDGHTQILSSTGLLLVTPERVFAILVPLRLLVAGILLLEGYQKAVGGWFHGDALLRTTQSWLDAQRRQR